jgi:mycofactocin glycosyltransferase
LALPPGFGLALDPSVRKPRKGVLVGGNPIRVIRLTPAGTALVDSWARGRPVGTAPGPQALARRLLDSGIAHPRPGSAPHPATNDVTVVMPVRDDPVGLAASLEAIEDARTVIVVDDGSEPAITPAQAPSARLIRRPVAGGPAAARNAGWKQATTGIVAFLDADCVPVSDWLDRLLAHFADPDVVAVAPRIQARAGPATPGWLAFYEKKRSSLDLGSSEAPVRPGSLVSYVPTAALLVRREALAEAGGFDETLRFGEDVDLVWRLGKGGGRIRYEPAVTATHPARKSAVEWLQQRFQYGRSAAALESRHGRDVAPAAMNAWSAGAWGLALAGYPGPAAAVALSTTAALARRAGSDRATARALAALGLSGHLRAGLSLAAAVRRAWLPPALAVAFGARRGRRRSLARTALVAALIAPAAAEWLSDPADTGLVTWVGLRLADDLAYQAGVWSGCVSARSFGALLPRLSGLVPW